MHLGYALERGLGCDRNEAEAVEWYKKAADQGQAVGQRNYALKTRDEGEALQYMRRAALQGNVEAMCDLGLYYARPDRTYADPAEAEAWLSKAVRLGLVRAHPELARFLSKRPSPDWPRVFALCREAAVQRSVSGVMLLAKCYLKGRGVERSVRLAHEKLALALPLHKAVGYPIAKLFFKHGYGTQADALAKLAAAAESYAKAARLLGRLHLTGWRRGGDAIEPNASLAVEWLRKAQGMGDAPAVRTLAEAYERGAHGVERDAAKARFLWQWLAHTHKSLPALERVLTTEVEAQKIL